MKRSSESGFALLLVFVMAGAIAIMLYKEMPRLVFESQRIKEQDLIRQGEEYQRAIQLYVRKNKKYPASIDDLERGTEIRYLRRRYKDPMTGKEEWRLVHIDNAGFYTDSLIHKREEEDEDKTENTFITEGAAFGSTGPPPGQETEGQGGANIRGASDRPAADASQYQGTPGAQQFTAPGQQVPAGQINPVAGGAYFPPGQGPGQVPPGYQQPGQDTQYPYNQPGTEQPGQTPTPNPNYPVGANQYVTPGAQGQAGTTVNLQQQGIPVPNPNMPVGPNAYVTPQTGSTAYPSVGVPGLPGPYGQQTATQPSMPSSGYPTGPTPPGYGRTGSAPQPFMGQPASAGGSQAAAANNPALGMINRILTTPRPGGLQGITGGNATGGQVVGGGIAGVATTLEAEGIMVYNERTKYQEWEFLYDFREDQQQQADSAMRGAGVGDNTNNPLGSSSGSSFGSSQGGSFGNSSGFGNTSGMGGSSSFGGGPGTPPPPGRGRR